MSRDSFTDLLSETILSIDNILNEDTNTNSSRETLQDSEEAIGQLPTIRDTLRAIAKSKHVAVRNGCHPNDVAALSSCRDKAEELYDIMSRRTSSDDSPGRMGRYWRSIKHLAKGHRVDFLVQAMVDDIRPLAEGRNVTIPPKQQPKKSVRWGDAEAEARTKLEEFRTRIDSLENKHASLKLFQWLCSSIRPLALNELRWALALDPSSPAGSIKDVTRKMGFIRDDDALERRIETLAHGLVEIRRHEKKTIAQFIHPSVSDYFKNLGLAQLDTEANSPAMALARAHVRLARECIHCFSIMNSPDDALQMPLYPYASMCWPLHAKEAEDRGLWLDTLADDLRLPSKKTFDILAYGLSRYRDSRLGITHLLMERRLYRTLLLNLPRLVDSGVDPNTRDELGRTTLALATVGGHEELLSALRLSGADPNICDIFGTSPLGHAAKLDGDSVASSLINPRPSSHRHSESNPLVCEDGEFQPEGCETYPPRPLDNMIPLDPDHAEVASRTPLAIAASCGNINVFKLLLNTEKVNPDARDANGHSPLALAAKNNHVGIVRMLLDIKTVDVNARDSDGRTPLSLAAELGHASVVSLLTETEGVDLNSRDAKGRTPLWRAIREGCLEVFRLLLRIDGVDLNVCDIGGETLLGYAARWNRQWVVRRLLEMDRLDMNKKDRQGQTALHIAAKRGHVATLDHLLCYPSVEVDGTDRFGATPLMLAASHGMHKAVDRLLEVEAVDVNRRDSDGNTPITLALTHHHAETAEVLFDSGRTDLTARDSLGSTPLSWAVRCEGADNLVQDIVKDPACDVNSADSKGRTPLMHVAMGRGRSRMARILIGSGKADLNLVDICDRTPLSWAASNSDKETVLAFLTVDSSIAVNQPDFQGRTPLSWAASEGDVDTVFSLLNQESIDIDGRDMMGRSPLFWAICRGRVDVAELLLSTRRVDLHPQDCNGLAPFDLIDDSAARSRLERTITNWKNRADGLCFYGEPWIPYPSESLPTLDEVPESSRRKRRGARERICLAGDTRNREQDGQEQDGMEDGVSQGEPAEELQERESGYAESTDAWASLSELNLEVDSSI